MTPQFAIPGFSVSPPPTQEVQRAVVTTRLHRLLATRIERPRVRAQIFSRNGKELLRKNLEREYIFVDQRSDKFEVRVIWSVDLPSNDYLLRYSLDGEIYDLPFTVTGPSVVSRDADSISDPEALPSR